MGDSFEELWNKWTPPPEPAPEPLPMPEPPARPAPRSAVVRVGAQVSLDLEGMPEAVLADVKRHLTFRNPLYTAMVRAGRYDPRITEHLTCWHVEENTLFTARGFANQLMRILQANRVRGAYVDRTNQVPPVELIFKGELVGYQWDLVRDIGDRRFGIIVGPTGCGKKVVALYLLSRARVPALVIVRGRSRSSTRGRR